MRAGYGLDLVWPALLKYPEDKIAVVDQICMVRPHLLLANGPSRLLVGWAQLADIAATTAHKTRC